MYKTRIRRLEKRVKDLEKISTRREDITYYYSPLSIGANIKYKRQYLGMKQEDLAEAVGISSSMLGKIERGYMVPNMMLGREIAMVFGCKVDDLMEIRCKPPGSLAKNEDMDYSV